MTPTELIARIRQVAQISDNDEDFTSAEILTEANQALTDRFARDIVNLRAGYWLQRYNTTTVARQSRYRIPDRAIANGLEKIELSTDGGQSYRQLSILTDSQSTDYLAQTSASDYPRFYSLEADSVVLYPTPTTAAGKLRFSYYITPSTMVTSATTSQVQTGAGSATDATHIELADNSFNTGNTIDILHASGSGELALVSATVATRTVGFIGYVYTFTDTNLDLSKAGLGNAVAIAAGTTTVVPLPLELHRTLADYTAAVILAAKGDEDRAGVFATKAEKSLARFVDLATPRVKANPYTFKTRNTYLRRRMTRSWW